MKKQLLAIGLVCMLGIAGCANGVPQEQYESVVAEKESLGVELDRAQSKNKELEKSNKELESEYQELLEKESTVQTSFGVANFEIPKDWKLESDNGITRKYFTKDGFVMIVHTTPQSKLEGQFSEEQEKRLIEIVKNTLLGDIEDEKNEYVRIANNILALKTDFTQSTDGLTGKCVAYTFFFSNEPYQFIMGKLTEGDFSPDFLNVLNSIR